MVFLIQRLAILDKMVLNSDESILYVGGAVSASWLTAAGKLIIAIYSYGQNLGSTLRRLFSHTSC